jgi:hypothetical protein
MHKFDALEHDPLWLLADLEMKLSDLTARIGSAASR